MVLPVVIGVVGATGLVGGTVIKQLRAAQDQLNTLLRASIRIVAVTNSKKMLVSSDLPSSWQDTLAQEGQTVDLQALAPLLLQAATTTTRPAEPQAPCAILVDATASEAAPDAYLGWLQAGVHVVTPNKKFGAGPLARHAAVQRLCLDTGRSYLQEASVGAGLPVLSTLKALVETGDKVHQVEGILSGTLSYIFNTYKPGMAFSAVVADAKAQGYTEPDPREDLSGMDVARKVVILARACGLDVTLDSLRVQSLVPAVLAGEGVSADEYMQRLPEFDVEIAQQADAADAAGEVIRFVGSVDVRAGTASIKLARYPKQHPFAQLAGTDNMLVFTTARYSKQPLIVRGPGAGAEVTAAGVLGDIIQAVRCHANSTPPTPPAS